MTRPWRERSGGLDLFVRLTPKSSRDALEGLETLADGQCVLKARVRAVPEDGKANAALIGLVAKQLKTPASRISLAAGATSRTKTLRIDGEAGPLAEMLEKVFAEKAARP
ncbi:hypothetical protein CCR94_04340 [Rhodoblastus sphagnicola]|uniref:UPF0235 protein CCR94_04340 n=1 Tax=Rhodoblastus sphagnicola TaxID=333368 RepID=A0A2S6NE15_9HYPH|nr:DUF167 family protein [Rhodoblastus sphagnicola]MBB4198400.1 hypothetical protein [Rhodoblastus sphagnicola]PPQ32868.1 hypothetical protein CCR94_04340 [Rhodoblastus sphagnicola]